MNELDPALDRTSPAVDPPGQIVMLDGQRWSLLLVLLSMDTVQQFHEVMGLRVPDGFLPTLREVVLRHARPEPRRPSTFVPDALTAIAETFGDAEAEAVVGWGRFVFAYDDTEHLDLRRWRALLDELAQDPAAWAELELPPRLRARAYERFLAEADRHYAHRLHEHVRGNPLSDWDVCMHVLRGFVPDDDDPEAHDPARWVRDTTAIARDREFWAWLLERLDERAQATLYAAARRLGDDDELRPPRVLVRSHGRT